MKTFLMIIAVGLAGAAFNTQAAMAPQLEKTLVAVCKAGASNNMIEFNHTMKENRINKQRIFPKLICNGETFYNFALNSNADRTAKRIAPYMKGTVTIKDIAMHNPSDNLYSVNF